MLRRPASVSRMRLCDVTLAGSRSTMLFVPYGPLRAGSVGPNKARSEEAFLRGTFGDFDEYCQKVPRLVPRLTRAYEGTGSFSRELYLKHREYNALIGAAALYAALVLKLLWRGPS